MSDEYEMVIGLYKQMVTVRDDFLRCPECDSSDAFTIYDDGAHCFSCNYSTKKVTNNMEETNKIAFAPVASAINIQ